MKYRIVLQRCDSLYTTAQFDDISELPDVLREANEHFLELDKSVIFRRPRDGEEDFYNPYEDSDAGMREYREPSEAETFIDRVVELEIQVHELTNRLNILSEFCRVT